MTIRKPGLASILLSSSAGLLVCVSNSGCATRSNDQANRDTIAIEPRMRQWVRIDPQWTDCGAVARDEFPPFPQYFRIQSNGNPESKEPPVPEVPSAYVVNPCDAKGDCSESTVFGSSLDPVTETAGSRALRSKEFVSWRQREVANGAPSCSYAVTRSTLDTLPPRNTLKLTVVIEEHVIEETCNPKEFVVPEKEPNCRGERTATSD